MDKTRKTIKMSYYQPQGHTCQFTALTDNPVKIIRIAKHLRLLRQRILQTTDVQKIKIFRIADSPDSDSKQGHNPKNPAHACRGRNSGVIKKLSFAQMHEGGGQLLINSNLSIEESKHARSQLGAN